LGFYEEIIRNNYTVRKKDPTLTAKIFEIKQANPKASDREVARILNINPMTVGKHTKSTEYLSLAHELAISNADKVQAAIEASHRVVMETLSSNYYVYRCPDCLEEVELSTEVSNQECKECKTKLAYIGKVPSKSAKDMAKTLYNTQTAKLMGTKASSTETEDRPIEDKQRLMEELFKLSRHLPESSN
jgi:DNA-directed RNA polymerase subunit RPC12/RpoP